MKKIEKLRRSIREQFTERLHAAVEKRFPGLKVETEWNIFTMNLVSRPTSKKKFTKEQIMFIAGFSDGYAESMGLVHE